MTTTASGSSVLGGCGVLGALLFGYLAITRFGRWLSVPGQAGGEYLLLAQTYLLICGGCACLAVYGLKSMALGQLALERGFIALGGCSFLLTSLFMAKGMVFGGSVADVAAALSWGFAGLVYFAVGRAAGKLLEYPSGSAH